MAPNPSQPDITVRGGVINVPHSTEPTRPLRHQPNTPRNKKQTKTRSDHKIPVADAPIITEEPTAPAAAPPVPPESEPEPASEE